MGVSYYSCIIKAESVIIKAEALMMQNIFIIRSIFLIAFASQG